MSTRTALLTIVAVLLLGALAYNILPPQQPRIAAAPPAEALPAPRTGGQAAEGSEPPIDILPLPDTSEVEPLATIEEMVIAPPEDAIEIREVPVFFATNRAPQSRTDPDDPTSAFSDVNGQITWGDAVITIPPHHEMGEIESVAFGFGWLIDRDPEKHVTVRSLTLFDRQTLLGLVAGELASVDNAILLYVHGYNTSFDKALRRTGQLTYDLAWQGPSFLFSWPSKGKTLSYFEDGTMADRSQEDLIIVLQELAALDPDRFVIIGHSMGTRVLTGALSELARSDPETAAKLTTIILAAPDIDANIFERRIAPRLSLMEDTHFTLYASSEDAALKASAKTNGFLRIGDTRRGVPAIEDFDVIDASDTVSDFFSHTYFGDDTSILSDIFSMIHDGLPVQERRTIAQMPGPPQPFWKIVVD